jgi:YesN/AraC family two-component response regulator
MKPLASSSRFSLLIVEDDQQAREVTSRMVTLKFPGCTIYCAGDGKVGLQLFQEHAPDMVLTDINMPEMDGIAMARAIRKMSPGTTCIVLTAYGDDKFFQQFKEIGFCAYLMKPVDFLELFAAIEKCCAAGKLGNIGCR